MSPDLINIHEPNLPHSRIFEFALPNSQNRRNREGSQKRTGYVLQRANLPVDSCIFNMHNKLLRAQRLGIQLSILVRLTVGFVKKSTSSAQSRCTLFYKLLSV